MTIPTAGTTSTGEAASADVLPYRLWTPLSYFVGCWVRDDFVEKGLPGREIRITGERQSFVGADPERTAEMFEHDLYVWALARHLGQGLDLRAINRASKVKLCAGSLFRPRRKFGSSISPGGGT